MRASLRIARAALSEFRYHERRFQVTNVPVTRGRLHDPLRGLQRAPRHQDAGRQYCGMVSRGVHEPDGNTTYRPSPEHGLYRPGLNSTYMSRPSCMGYSTRPRFPWPRAGCPSRETKHGEQTRVEAKAHPECRGRNSGANPSRTPGDSEANPGRIRGDSEANRGRLRGESAATPG